MVSAHHVLGLHLSKNDFDVGLFDRPMLGAGVVSGEAHRIFTVMDAARPGGPSGHLPFIDIAYALDHAHCLAWLEAFHSRLAATAKGRSVADVIKKAGESIESESPNGDSAVVTALDLESALATLGFPAELVQTTCAFLERMCSPQQEPLAALADLMSNAFEGRSRAMFKNAAGKAVNIGRIGRLLRGPSNDNPNLQKQKTMGTSVEAPLDLATRGHIATSSTSAPPPGNEQQGVSPICLEEALVNTRQLRRQVMFSFANYQDAYDIFALKRPEDGVALDEWMEAMSSFGFTNPSRWELIFGNIVDWQHMRWDPRFRGTEGRVTISKFASSLDSASPCETPMALRKLLQEQFGSGASCMQKAWALLAGQESTEEVGLPAWRNALQSLSVTGDDAGYVFAALRAAPILERSRNPRSQDLSRGAFMATMRAAESITRFLDIFLWLQEQHGIVSQAFEACAYSHEPLPVSIFEEQLVALLQITAAEARMLFSLFDFHQDNVVAIDDVLEAFTTMQATYLPYHKEKDAEPVLVERLCAETEPAQSRSSSQRSAASSLRMCVRSISAMRSCISPSDMSPTDMKNTRSIMGGSAGSAASNLYNISTALPDSDSDDAPPSRPESRQRPHTSMAVIADSSDEPPSQAARTSDLRDAPGRNPRALMRKALAKNLTNFTKKPLLPHLDLATPRFNDAQSSADADAPTIANGADPVQVASAPAARPAALVSSRTARVRPTPPPRPHSSAGLIARAPALPGVGGMGIGVMPPVIPERQAPAKATGSAGTRSVSAQGVRRSDNL